MTPREDEDGLETLKIANEDNNIQAERKSSRKDSILSFLRRKREQRSTQGQFNGKCLLKCRIRTGKFINMLV